MNKKALIYGVIGGIVSIAINLLIYIMDPTFFGSFWTALLFWPISIIIMVFAGIAVRKDNGGFLKFGEAFLNTWIAGVVMTVISTLFTIVLFNVIDPGLADLVSETILQNTAEMMSGFGMPEAALEEAMMETAKGLEGAFEPGKLLMNIFGAAIGLAIVALIVGLIVKRNPPENV